MHRLLVALMLVLLVFGTAGCFTRDVTHNRGTSRDITRN